MSTSSRAVTAPVQARPAAPDGRGPLAALAFSAVLLAIAPLVVSDSYSWIRHTTSESAGQLVEGSWVARSGFALFGLAVLWLTDRRGSRWGHVGRAAHTCFGLSMIATAVFSSRAWHSGVPFDAAEDALHSVASFVVGMSFICGVASVGAHRFRNPRARRWRDPVALLAVVCTLTAMSTFQDAEGFYQRIMFATAYLWYGAESLTRAEL